MKTTLLGFQHLLAMYAGAVLVPLIVGNAIGLTPTQLTYLVSIDILMCGIATLLQISRNKYFGVGLPVVLGCTFTAVGPMILIGNDYGISAIYGAVIASGVIIFFISRFFGSLVKFFPPIVTGSVVTIIGITLIPVAINNMGGGQGAEDFGSMTNVLLSFGTLLFIVLLFRFTSGFMQSIAILLGLVGGTIAAIFLGIVDFSNVQDASYVHMVMPFYLATPTFHLLPIAIMTLVAMVSLVESTGVYFALGDICEEEIDKKMLEKGYRAEGLASVIGGIFNAFPYTTFSQNVGLMQLSGVKSRRVIFVTAIMLISLGFLPKIAALATIIPPAVLGGAMVAMFGMVVSQGIKMLSPVISKTQDNAMIVACSIGIGLGVSVVPDLFKELPESVQILTSNGIVLGSITAIFLNIIFNMLPSKKKQAVQQAHQAEAMPLSVKEGPSSVLVSATANHK
ncbi:purine permease [Sporosarcina sp. P21c]|uniref:nucleobase:cation symporter-2 family protein n=1 Tax=Sporosarcina TaxID=1569 RepID=UPI000A15293B|nr:MULTISPECIES: nucleobase:cation symporter-2 family protein [Sporosarcina]ARJ40145.1 xanthine permease [Sporosarcina ureae]PIC68656.1 purine permease [Sporosarcina sp. P16a]PIC84570.1 purine permease [Sporosarcina sp. P1]PIC91158.1 purine permease [Sporosarcina sp. P21c]PIC93709.1 purine permease [Sporosarcina sp. P25]